MQQQQSQQQLRPAAECLWKHTSTAHHSTPQSRDALRSIAQHSTMGDHQQSPCHQHMSSHMMQLLLLLVCCSL